jgi:hypothetical protein
MVISSSAISPSGTVSKRDVKPVPAPLVEVLTILAPKIRSFAFVVVAEPLLLLALLPELPAVTSTGLFRSTPLYSSMRMSGKAAARENVTTTLFDPAPAATIFFA